ncbi:putative Polysaccharide deacetylase family protein [Candidatus Magnetomoraceae bacterium gMMP-15]
MLIPVLMYHDVKADDYNLSNALPQNRPYIQKISQFNKQIEYIKNNDFITLTVSELDKEVLKSSERKEVSSKKVVITFDDGDQSNYDHAFKVLLKNNLKATFFITTNFIDQATRVTWKQLKEMQAAGMEIGSHTVSHPVPSSLTDSQMMYELSESKKILELGLSSNIQSFSLPTGFYNPKIKNLAYKAGYSFVCISRVGFCDINAFSPFDIKRIAIKRSTSYKEFIEYVECKRGQLYQKMIIENLKSVGKRVLGVRLYDIFKNFILRGRIQ